MSEKILVVDDEHDIADLIEVYLKNDGFTVYKYYSPVEALNCIDNIDLAILDIMMEKIDGFEFCKILREKYVFPVIMLTARDEEVNKIKGLNVGADDYITKPFQPFELMARVKAQLRRYKQYNVLIDNDTDILEYKLLWLNRKTHECTIDGQEIALTPTEFSVLQFLLEKRGQVVNVEELFHYVWQDEYYNKGNNTIAVHIRHLREKMQPLIGEEPYIKTVWGVGYRI